MASYFAPRILLIVPCFNESGSIVALLREISTVGGFDTVVIDDGSFDATAQLAAPLSPTVRLVANLGIGGAVQTGLKYACANNYDYCAQIDGDGQHPPAEYKKLLAAARTTGANIVIGSRYADVESFRSTFMRRLGSRLIGYALYLAGGRLKISDPTSGMRLFDRRAMQYFAQYYPADYPEPISLAWAVREKMTVEEVSVEMRERVAGRSSLSGIRKSVSYMVRVICYVLVAAFQKRRPVYLSDEAEA